MASTPQPSNEPAPGETIDGFYESEDARRRANRTIRALMALLFYQGAAGAIAPVAAPWIAKSFGLDESAMARVFAWLALGALGALGLSRMVDRFGRRRMLLWATAAMPACALGAAISTNLAMFVFFEIALNAFVGAAGAASIVILAEELPIARRAHGQSMGGLANSAGSGIAVALMPVLVQFGLSWRWQLVLIAGAVVLLPQLARAVPESERWEKIARKPESDTTRFYDVFIPLYRRRSVVMVICTLLAVFAFEGVNSWAYFHAVSVIGLSATVASLMTLIGGGLGMVGFLIGAWTAERVGRVRTVVIGGLGVAMGALMYFWGPPAHFAHPAIWLTVAFCFLNLVGNAVTVASNAAVTELFPTALRGTIIGWFAITGALAALSAEATISVLTHPLGGMSVVVGWLSLLAIPGALLFGVAIDETQGLSLEQAANEDQFELRERH